jgi:hypothetical protein
LYKPVKRDKNDDSCYIGNDSLWGTIAGIIEAFHLSFNDVLWGMDWLNLQLLMMDKLSYVGAGKGKKRVMTKEEEYKALLEMTIED